MYERLRKAISKNPKIKEIEVTEIEKFSDLELQLTLHQLYKDKNKEIVEEEDVKRDEFYALLKAAKYGHPPEHTGKPTRFEVEKTKVVYIDPFKNKWNLPFVVVPVKTLSVVLVQRGYRREIGDSGGEVVQTFFEDKLGDAWFPGIETTGEGIFIHLKDHILNNRNDENWNRWLSLYEDHQNCKYHPLFVWWHSLSHSIISSISIEAGYSSASIRERIYLNIDKGNIERVNGGILLYTAQTGGDGTLGGLIVQTSNFVSTLNRAANRIEACSNDPLCMDQKVGTGKENGAACYTCMLLSETSCEYGNKLLDRNLLKGDMA